MAEFITHHLFGARVCNVLPAPAKRAVQQYPASYYWGCQGPDPLFFRKVLRGGPLHKLGNRMHDEQTEALFYAFLRAVNSLTGERRTIAESYFYGFVCHYALDSEVHPYVYYLQDKRCTKAPKLHPSAVHCQIETDMDYLLYEQSCGLPPTAFVPAQYYTMSAIEKAVIAAVLRVVLQLVYHTTVSTGDLRAAFDEMLTWQTLFFGEHHKLYATARRVERITGRGALLTSHMKLIRPTWDALNEQRKPWYSLWEPDRKRTESVADLILLARMHALSLCGRFVVALDEGRPRPISMPAPFSNGKPRKAG